MRRIALSLALLVAVAACGTSPSAPDAVAAPGDARFDGSQMGSGNRNPPPPPADTTGLGG